MTPEAIMRDDALTKRVLKQTGVAFGALWQHVHIHLYPVPDDAGPTREMLLADPTPWRLRLTQEGVLPSHVLLDPSHRSLLTAWALLRWLVVEGPTGSIAAKARAEVDREIHTPWTLAGAKQAIENARRAKLARKKAPSHIDHIKELMRPYKRAEMAFDEFLKIAEGRNAGPGVHGLRVSYREDEKLRRRYQVEAEDCPLPAPSERSEAAVKRWYSESDRATLRT